MSRPCSPSLTLYSLLAILLAFTKAPTHSHTILDTNDSGPKSLTTKEFIQPIEDLDNAASSYNRAYDGLGDIESHADDDENGYLKKKASKGSKGYKHFDSFHKRDGDKWAGQKHSGYGGDKKGGDGGSYFTSSSYNYDSRDKDGNNKAALKVDGDDDRYDHGEYSHDEESDHDGDHDRYDDGHSQHFDDHDDHDHYDRDSGYDGEGEGDHNGYQDEGQSYHEEMDQMPRHVVGSNLGSSAYRGGGRGVSPYQGGGGGGGGGGGATSYYIRHY